MSKFSIQDGAESFEVTLLTAKAPSRVVLFSVGGGGNPERHLPLLTSIAERGATVVAPHFDRLTSSFPSESDLLLRARRLRLALDAVPEQAMLVAGIGHSIGATLLIALAGGQAWMRSGQPLTITPDPRLDRLVLLAPATGYFQAPSALNALRTPLLVWAGTRDVITPIEQAEFLRDTLGDQVPVELRIVQDASHFTFLDMPPPQTTEAHPNREAFLSELSAAIGTYVMR